LRDLALLITNIAKYGEAPKSAAMKQEALKKMNKEREAADFAAAKDAAEFYKERYFNVI
jgi:hypothetical protein